MSQAGRFVVNRLIAGHSREAREFTVELLQKIRPTLVESMEIKVAPAVNLTPTRSRGSLSTARDPQFDAELQQLLDRRRVNHSLEAPFYTSKDVYAADIAGIFGTHWLFAGSTAEVPEPGDYITVEYGPFSIILIKNDDEGVDALHNVCRHRGARLLPEKSGSTGNIVCGYHSWTYVADGTLLHATTPGENFDKSCYSLKRAHVRVIAGLIFVCLADEAPNDLDKIATRFGPYFEPHGLGNAKVAYQQDLVENANWKLVMENNRECYHCEGHPELLCAYFPIHGMTEETLLPSQREAWDREKLAKADLHARCDQYGLPYENIEELDTRVAGFWVSREPLDGMGESFSATGSRLSNKLIGAMPEFKLGRASMHIQPNCWFHVMADHAITFAVYPISESQTLVRTTWLVASDAVEGVDYDVDALTYVWKQTNLQDRTLVQLAQTGVNSPAYEPGPYMKSEYQVECFINWYIQRMKEHLS